MPPVGFEPTISAGERPKTYALDRAATGIGWSSHGGFKDWQFLYVPPGLTFKNSTWCSLCVACFVQISDWTATSALYIIN